MRLGKVRRNPERSYSPRSSLPAPLTSSKLPDLATASFRCRELRGDRALQTPRFDPRSLPFPFATSDRRELAFSFSRLEGPSSWFLFSCLVSAGGGLQV